MIRLHLPHAIVLLSCTRIKSMSLPGNGGHHWCLSRSISLSVGVSIHGCCPVRATGGSPLYGHYLLAPLTGNKEGRKGLIVLRIMPTPTRLPTNCLHTPMDNTPLHSIPSVRRPWLTYATDIHPHSDQCCKFQYAYSHSASSCGRLHYQRR